MRRTKLLLWAVYLLFCIAAVSCDNDHGYVARLKAALNSTGLPQSQPLRTQSVNTVSTDFNCPPLNDISPVTDNVNELSPKHIKVVGAMGDSMTAAMGAKATSLINNFIEYRGVSWSIGGDDTLSEVTTVPNVIKEYNPGVKGFSIKTGMATSPNARFNVAVSGAIAEDMPGQAEELVHRIKADNSINFQEDWKLVSIWIGGNDLCAVCEGNPKHSPENYAAFIESALDILKRELPRTFVNLIQILDATKIAPLRGLVCDAVHLFVCRCPTNERTMPETRRASEEYQEKLTELVNSGKYDSDNDFTVVIQPFFVDSQLPRDANGNPDKTYFAPDCFHFSEKGHRDAAVALWNNMVEPVGSKTKELILGAPLKCPTEESPYFYTRKNSGLNANFHAEQSNSGGDTGAGEGNNLRTILLGTSVSLFVVLVVGGAVIGVVVWRRRRRRRQQNWGLTVSTDGEKVSLVTK